MPLQFIAPSIRVSSCCYLTFCPLLARSAFLTQPTFRFTSSNTPLRGSLLRNSLPSLAMDNVGASPIGATPFDRDEATQEKYASMSKLLLQFTEIPNVDKAWTCKSKIGESSQAMFLISQPNLLANKKRQSILTSHILKTSSDSVSFHWAPFPIEMTGVSAMVPSPSGLKTLIIRNTEGDSPTHIEIWDQAGVEREFAIPRSIHGSIFSDGWFQGISWNSSETIIAYVAEAPDQVKPKFSGFGYKKDDKKEKDLGTWNCQGEWEEDWGETYAGKRKPSLFVIDICSGEVCTVEGISRDLSVGQVVWTPSSVGQQHLVFVGWSSGARKLGIKYCYNRPCALYAVEAPTFGKTTSGEKMLLTNLTPSISSAFFPHFSPDGKFLIFVSAKCSVDSGAHSATDSLHKLEWPSDGKFDGCLKISDVVPAVMFPEEEDSFPGLYSSKFLTKPWLSDGHTIVISSIWGSVQTIISVNTLSGQVSRISPLSSNSSWDILALDGDNIIAVSSSLTDIPKIKYGGLIGKEYKWNWLDVASPVPRCSEKVLSTLAALESTIFKIPVRNVSENLTEGGRLPFEAIYVSPKSSKRDSSDPLVVILHGGPHSVSLASFSTSSAFLASLGYSLLIVNYRGSLGFGEEALQSLPGNVGSQDVEDVLSAIDFAIDKGLADPSKVAVVGGSHGGFLTTHLIGQAPEKFTAAVARNPVCNLALMLGTTDIPDWCFFETYGKDGKTHFTEAPSADHLALLHSKSPISHISKVKTPTLLLLGAQDLRVPVSNGIQYARALKEKGVESKVIVFPKDIHSIDRPQSDFESFLNIGLWFKKYCS